MFTKYFICLLSLTYLLLRAQALPQEGYVRPQCMRGMPWVIYHAHRPYLMMFNSPHCPSWMTKHIITKERQNTHLTLPKGIPFSAQCGSCWRGLRAQLNFKWREKESIREMKTLPIRSSRGLVHSVRGFSCLMAHGLTGPVEAPGEISCILKFKSNRTMDETITYSVKETPIVIYNQTIFTSRETKQVILECPRHPEAETLDNPLTHVWFEALNTGPSIIEPSNNPIAVIPLSGAFKKVSCATYHIMNPLSVVIQSYNISFGEGEEGNSLHYYFRNQGAASNKFSSVQLIFSLLIAFFVVKL